MNGTEAEGALLHYLGGLSVLCASDPLNYDNFLQQQEVGRSRFSSTLNGETL